MSTQNLYLKQISCLQSPICNQGWHEIVRYFPGASVILVEEQEKSQPVTLEVEAKAIQGEQKKCPDTVNEPIPWCMPDIKRQDEGLSKPIQLKSFAYDCSYVTPFVRNIYAREKAAKGWFRWVGPDPSLEVRLPLGRTESENWLFTVTFQAFLEETHAQSVAFEVNGKRKPLKWLEETTYQSTITSIELKRNPDEGELTAISLSITGQEPRRAAEDDQRMIVFAIRELSLIPYSPS